MIAEKTAKVNSKKAAAQAAKIARRVEMFRAALEEAKAALDAGEDLRVSISAGNSKMGAVPSASTLPILTCPSCCRGTCAGDCYAAKLAALRPAVLRAYARNTALMLYAPAEYWQQIRDYVRGARFFRFHVSGDIFGLPYLAQMVAIARENPHCELLAFTKAFRTVNMWIDANGELPANLHILFSGWRGLDPVNPHGLPETSVIFKGDDVPENWKICGGNCFECACRGLACWQAQKGDVIAFHKH